MISRARINDELGGTSRSKWTFFLPPEEELRRLLEIKDDDERAIALRYYLVRSAYSTTAMSRSQYLDTHSGQRIAVDFEDDRVTVDGVRITGSPIECENGVIYRIDGALSPELSGLLEVIAERDDATQFSELLNKTSLPKLLEGTIAFTVFVPTDSAFEQLTASELSALKSLPPSELTSWMRSFVVMGRVYIEGSTMPTSKRTLANSSLGIDKLGTRFAVNSQAPIAEADVEASNGVIHVVDRIPVPLPSR